METNVTETQTAVETVRAPKKSVWFGVLSNLLTTPIEGGEIVTATMSRAIKGVPTDTTIYVQGEALKTVGPMLVDGANVRLYGEPVEGGFRVIGPDLSRRTLMRAEGGESAPVAAAPATKPAKPKRPMSEKQMIAWNTIILPKLQAGQAAKKAEREAAKAAAAAEMPAA